MNTLTYDSGRKPTDRAIIDSTLSIFSCVDVRLGHGNKECKPANREFVLVVPNGSKNTELKSRLLKQLPFCT